jgi:penicillin-binding protein 1A
MSNMMADVVNAGTGAGARSVGFRLPAAGKTGTTNDSRDAWFIGMTPRLLAGVWLGFDDPQTIVPNGSGGDLAAPVWARFMQVANGRRKAVRSWDAPAGIVSVAIDANTGFRATPECMPAEVREEYFLSGTEPAGGCYYDLYGPDGWTVYDSVDSTWTGYQPDTLMERLRWERRRYLDSLDAVRRYRDSTATPYPPPTDTVMFPPAPRDTVRPWPAPGTPPPDTTIPTPPPLPTVVPPRPPGSPPPSPGPGATDPGWVWPGTGGGAG